MSPAEAVAHLRAAGVPDPSVRRGDGVNSPRFHLYTAGIRLCSAHTLRDALRVAGYPAPPPSQFASDGRAVKLGDAEVATARSTTMATRIANALNRYHAGPRGF